METKNITQSNKLIAEFMGITPIVENNGVVYKDPNTGHIMIIRYHNSWDWIMPVIDKIYSINEYEKYKYTLSQFSEGLVINTKYIETTWANVVEFIEWYNLR